MVPFLRTTFESEIISASSWKDSEISRASLEGLRGLIPEEVDLQKNPDLISIAFNGSVANLCNKNDDCVGTAESIILAQTAFHKSLNLEHKSEKIIGHLITSGFSTFGDNKILTEDEAREMVEPFNVSFGAVVYRKIYPELGNLIMSSTDPKHKFYKKISSSFEVAFNEFHIAIGSDKLHEAEIVSDPKKIAELRKYLRKYGGSGQTPQGEKIYRKIIGANILTVAHALVSRPAASVSGLIADNGKQKSTATISLFAPKEKKCVIIDKTPNLLLKNMDIEETIQEMAASVKALVSENKNEEAVASVRKTIESAIKEANKEFIMERDKARCDREASEAKLTELYAQVEKMSTQMSNAERKMYEIEEQSRAAKTMIRYNERMAAMQDEYEMDEEDCAVVASELKTLEVKDEDDKDETFAAFKDKMGKLWKHKNKTAKATYQKELDDKINAEVTKKLAELSTASTVKTGEEGKTVDKALEDAKATEEKSVTNNNENIGTEKTLAERFGSALKVKISQ
jgi:hypothetical protein